MYRMLGQRRSVHPIVEMSFDWLLVAGAVALALWIAMNLALWGLPEVASGIG